MINISVSKEKLLKEGGWSAFGKITTAIGTLAGMRLMTEFIPKEVYGKVSLLIGLITLCCNLFASPVLAATQRFHSEMILLRQLPLLRYSIIYILKWSVILVSSLLLVAGLFLCRSGNLSYFVFVVLIAFMVANIMRNFEISLLTAARRQKAVAIISVIEAWLKPIIAVALVLYLGSTPQSVILGYFVALGCILLFFYILPIPIEGKSDSKTDFNFDRNLMKKIQRYSVPLVPLALVGWCISLSDRYIIGARLGIENVGIYAAGYGLVSMSFLMVSGIITQTLKPAYFQAISNNNINRTHKILKTWIIITISICVLGVTAIFFLKHLIVYWLLASEYRNCAALMPWIAIGISFQIISQILENVLFAYKHTELILLTHTFSAIVCLVSVYLLTLRYGLIGAAYACPVYYLCMAVAGLFAVKTIKV